MRKFRIDQPVSVGPDLASNHLPDRQAPPWQGSVTYITPNTVGVKPVDGGPPKNVMQKRVTPIRRKRFAWLTQWWADR